MAISGDTIVVGAPLDDHSGKEDPGSAYVFVKSGASWNQQAKLQAQGAGAGDAFGASVAIDGDTILVGATHANESGVSEAGAAYAFFPTGTSWALQDKFSPAGLASGDMFGVSVAISGDTMLAGAAENEHDGELSGAAYAFQRNAGTWLFDAKLTASDGAGERFGRAVTVRGTTAVVGADWDRGSGFFSGAAYVFTRVGFQTWQEDAVLAATDCKSMGYFGVSVSLNEDASALAVGATPNWDSSCCSSVAGSVYVFAKEGTSWTELDKLEASDAASSDQLGVSVSWSGNWIVAGADGDDESAGAAYVSNKAPRLPRN